jgi:polyphosphate glucokinase
MTKPIAEPEPEPAGRSLVGVDVGGSGIKGAPVNLDHGMASDRKRIPTPQPATPDAVAQVIAQVTAHFEVTGPIGCTLPAVVLGNVVKTAAHIDASWIGTNAGDRISESVGRECVVMNDADAAGVAETRFGAARDRTGVVLLVTIGTGVGTALLQDGVLVANSELGHLPVGRHIADTWVSDATRDAKGLSWKEWASRFDTYLTQLHQMLWPELIVVGGGIVKHSHRFLDRLDPGCEVVIAELGNLAGIVGAAVMADTHLPSAPAKPTSP